MFGSRDVTSNNYFVLVTASRRVSRVGISVTVWVRVEDRKGEFTLFRV